jgi:hypothetical protein
MSTNDSVGAQGTGTSTDTEQLRSDIGQTRAGLGDDVTALSEKMNPGARMSRAVGTARGNIASATSRAREAAPRTAQNVREHPAPVAAGALALAGATATALLTRRRAAKARAARKRAAAGPWSALAGAAATAFLARRRAGKARTARTRAAAGPWFRR